MVDFARAEQQRIRKAKTLAAWCAAHGLGPDATTAPAPILRAMARAAGVRAPQERGLCQLAAN